MAVYDSNDAKAATDRFSRYHITLEGYCAKSRNHPLSRVRKAWEGYSEKGPTEKDFFADVELQKDWEGWLVKIDEVCEWEETEDAER